MGIIDKKKTNVLTKMCIILIVVGSIIVISSLLFIIKKNNENDIAKEKTIIKIWALYGDVGNTLVKVTDNYTKENPNVVFEISLFKNDIYKSVIREAVITNDAPDIFYAWGDQFLKDFVNLGAIKDINNICEKENVYKNISEENLKSFTIDGNVYSVPLFGWKLMLFANEDLFINNNIKIPENYEEFIQAIKSFKELGIVPLSVGAEESWTLSFYYMMLALKNVGIEGVKEALKDNSKFNNEGFLKAAEEFKELCDIDAFSEDTLNLESYNSDFYFSEKKSAMTLNGTWLIPQIEKSLKENNNDINELKLIDISYFVGKKYGIGGFVDGFVINSNSDKQEIIDNLYIDIFKEVSDIYIKEMNGGIPVWNDQKIDVESSHMLYEAAKDFQNYSYHGAYDLEMPYNLAKVHLDSIELLFNDDITPEMFIDRHVKNN